MRRLRGRVVEHPRDEGRIVPEIIGLDAYFYLLNSHLIGWPQQKNVKYVSPAVYLFLLHIVFDYIGHFSLKQLLLIKLTSRH